MSEQDRQDDKSQEIDLEKVGRLIEALELDLARVRSGSEDMKRLRDEVETLKNVLNSRSAATTGCATACTACVSGWKRNSTPHWPKA